MPTIFPTPLSLDRGGHGARRAFAHPTISADLGDHRLTSEKLSNKIYWQNGNCIPMWPYNNSLLSKETTMKLALIGVGFAAAAAFATPALAQAVIEDPGYCAQFYPNANCDNLGPGNPYTDGGYYRDWRNGNAMMPDHATRSTRRHRHAEPDRYHGGPKEDE